MENVKITLNKMRLDGEIRNVPIGFVNALRRILLADIPGVVLSNIEILDNNTQLTHEMLRHRIEMLPVNVRPEEAAVIRDTKIELKLLPSTEAREITTDDFVVTGPRGDVLLKDRDLGDDLYFMTVKANESIHIRATLAIETRGISHVCVSTFKNHIDPEQAKTDRGLYIDNGGDPRVFDNFLIQRSYAKDEDGRPYWFDFAIESIGVIEAKDLLRRAVEILQAKLQEWVKLPIQREEQGWFRMEMEGETFTIGQLAQELMYKGGLVEFVSRDIEHPLVPKLIVRFNTKYQPEQVVDRFKTQALALCESILKSV
jgi:DNA-directed RNA polymerase subunit L